MSFDGAGGTSGGIGRFFLGLAMLIGGGYLLLDAIQVNNIFSMSTRIYAMGNMSITSGMMLIPMIFGTQCRVVVSFFYFRFKFSVWYWIPSLGVGI